MFTHDTQFALAVQALVTLALGDGSPTSSARLAERLHTHPAYLRGLLGKLRGAGLVVTRRGKGGGTVLAQPPEAISLLAIYRVTDGAAEVAPHGCGGSSCPVAGAMPRVLHRIGQRLDAAVARELSSISVGDVLRWTTDAGTTPAVPGHPPGGAS